MKEEICSVCNVKIPKDKGRWHVPSKKGVKCYCSLCKKHVDSWEIPNPFPLTGTSIQFIQEQKNREFDRLLVGFGVALASNPKMIMNLVQHRDTDISNIYEWANDLAKKFTCKPE